MDESGDKDRSGDVAESASSADSVNSGESRAGSEDDRGVSSSELVEREAPGGGVVYVDRTDAERGTDGPFYVVYADTDRESRWGFACGNCDSLRTAMDPMGRIRCGECANLRKATEWDAAHE